MKRLIFLMCVLSVSVGCNLVDEVAKEVDSRLQEPVTVEQPAEELPRVPQPYNVTYYWTQFLSSENITIYGYGAFAPIPVDTNYKIVIVAGDSTTLYSRSITPSTLDENDRYFPIILQVKHSPVEVYLEDDEGYESTHITFTYDYNTSSWIIDYNLEEVNE